MRYLVKPFLYLVGSIYYLCKILSMIVAFAFCVIWTFSIKESIDFWKSEFEYFYASSICRGTIILYQYKTIHDFVNGNKVNIYKL